jgi:hypothetical protein
MSALPPDGKWPLASDLHGDYVPVETGVTFYCRARERNATCRVRSRILWVRGPRLVRLAERRVRYGAIGRIRSSISAFAGQGPIQLDDNGVNWGG